MAGGKLVTSLSGVGVLIVEMAAPQFWSDAPKWVWEVMLWVGIALILAGPVWWSLAKLNLQFQSPVVRRQIEQPNSREAASEPSRARDWTMRQAFQWWVDTLNKNAGEEGLEFFRPLRQAAVDGRVTVWGRRDIGMLGIDAFDFKPLEKIDLDFWKDNDFDSVRYIFADDDDMARKTGTDPDGGMGTRYFDLMVSSQEVKALFN